MNSFLKTLFFCYSVLSVFSSFGAARPETKEKAESAVVTRSKDRGSAYTGFSHTKWENNLPLLYARNIGKIYVGHTDQPKLTEIDLRADRMQEVDAQFASTVPVPWHPTIKQSCTDDGRLVQISLNPYKPEFCTSKPDEKSAPISLSNYFPHSAALNPRTGQLLIQTKDRRICMFNVNDTSKQQTFNYPLKEESQFCWLNRRSFAAYHPEGEHVYIYHLPETPSDTARDCSDSFQHDLKFSPAPSSLIPLNAGNSLVVYKANRIQVANVRTGSKSKPTSLHHNKNVHAKFDRLKFLVGTYGGPILGFTLDPATNTLEQQRFDCAPAVDAICRTSKTTFATASDNNGIKLWDWRSGKCYGFIPSERQFTCLIRIPDGFISQQRNGMIHQWRMTQLENLDNRSALTAKPETHHDFPLSIKRSSAGASPAKVATRLPDTSAIAISPPLTHHIAPPAISVALPASSASHALPRGSHRELPNPTTHDNDARKLAQEKRKKRAFINKSITFGSAGLLAMYVGTRIAGQKAK